MKQFTAIVCLILVLPACGAYFVTTGGLTSKHQEGLAPSGVWAAEEMTLAIYDGPETSDRICMYGDDDRVLADGHFLLIGEQIMVILSNLVFKEDKVTSGELIFGLEQSDTLLLAVNLFGEISEGDELPFAKACDAPNPDTSLTAANYVPFCLDDAATPEDIAKWATEQNGLETIEFYARPDTDIPEFCL